MVRIHPRRPNSGNIMVRARLHLICGNCGCNDEWEWEFIPEEDMGPEEDPNPPTVWLWCKNCRTLHNISDNAEEKLS